MIGSDRASIQSALDHNSLAIGQETETLLARSLARAVGENFDSSSFEIKVQLRKDARDIMGAAAIGGLMLFPRSRMAEPVERYVRMEIERAKKIEADQANGNVRALRDARESIEPSPPIPSDPRIRSFIGRPHTVHQEDGEIWDTIAARYRAQECVPRTDPNGDETSQRTHCLGNDGRPVECDPK